MSTSATAEHPSDPLYVLDDPDDQKVTFFLDAMHFPYALSPLFQSMHGASFAQGVTRAASELHAPILTVQHRVRNNFQFERFVMPEYQNDEEARQKGELAEATLKPEIGRLRDRWEQEHLPRILEIQAELRSIAGAPPLEAASAKNIAGIRALQAELWTIHFRIVIPMLLAMQLFDEFFADLFGVDADSHALVAGIPSASVRAGGALADLARYGQSLGLASAITETPSDLLVTRLSESEAGREFLTRLAEFHQQYGLRQDLFDLVTPTWQENPEYALSTIRNYLANGRDISADHEERARRADQAITTAREHLASYPQPVQQQFDGMLKAARDAAFLQEEHNFYIDQQSLALVRLAFLKIARHLVDVGCLDSPDDVFMLHVDELLSAVTGDDVDFRQLARDRRHSFEASQTMTPPPFIGAPPAGPPPGDNPMKRAMGRFFGGPPQESDDPSIIKGTPGSRGFVTGIAFVARTLEEATAIRPGQILVTMTTMPPWTPLFGIAAAIVTETGGPLCHCAIVAREYGIPAVVSAHGATTRLKSGQTITVDGTNGVIKLEG
ncbi:hypothetical protein BH23CHL5_BH23CHL5_27500 [soil metagenome]